VLSFSIFAFFILIYLQILGNKSLITISSLRGTIILCHHLTFGAFLNNYFYEVVDGCASAIAILLVIFLWPTYF
jgi:hypothetical protein